MNSLLDSFCQSLDELKNTKKIILEISYSILASPSLVRALEKFWAPLHKSFGGIQREEYMALHSRLQVALLGNFSRSVSFNDWAEDRITTSTCPTPSVFFDTFCIGISRLIIAATGSTDCAVLTHFLYLLIDNIIFKAQSSGTWKSIDSINPVVAISTLGLQIGPQQEHTFNSGWDVESLAPCTEPAVGVHSRSGIFTCHSKVGRSDGCFRNGIHCSQKTTQRNAHQDQGEFGQSPQNSNAKSQECGTAPIVITSVATKRVRAIQDPFMHSNLFTGLPDHIRPNLHRAARYKKIAQNDVAACVKIENALGTILPKSQSSTNQNISTLSVSPQIRHSPQNMSLNSNLHASTLHSRSAPALVPAPALALAPTPQLFQAPQSFSTKELAFLQSEDLVEETKLLHDLKNVLFAFKPKFSSPSSPIPERVSKQKQNQGPLCSPTLAAKCRDGSTLQRSKKKNESLHSPSNRTSPKRVINNSPAAMKRKSNSRDLQNSLLPKNTRAEDPICATIKPFKSSLKSSHIKRFYQESTQKMIEKKISKLTPKNRYKDERPFPSEPLSQPIQQWLSAELKATPRSFFASPNQSTLQEDKQSCLFHEAPKSSISTIVVSLPSQAPSVSKGSLSDTQKHVKQTQPLAKGDSNPKFTRVVSQEELLPNPGLFQRSGVGILRS